MLQDGAIRGANPPSHSQENNALASEIRLADRSAAEQSRVDRRSGHPAAVPRPVGRALTRN